MNAARGEKIVKVFGDLKFKLRNEERWRDEQKEHNKPLRTERKQFAPIFQVRNLSLSFSCVS